MFVSGMCWNFHCTLGVVDVVGLGRQMRDFINYKSYIIPNDIIILDAWFIWIFMQVANSINRYPYESYDTIDIVSKSNDFWCIKMQILSKKNNNFLIRCGIFPGTLYYSKCNINSRLGINELKSSSWIILNQVTQHRLLFFKCNIVTYI